MRSVKAPRAKRLTFTCRGVTIRGKVEYAKGCRRECKLTEAQARFRQTRTGNTFDLSTRSYVCRACQGLPRVLEMVEARRDHGKVSEKDLTKLDRAGLNRKPRDLREAGRISAAIMPASPPTDPQRALEGRLQKRQEREDQIARGVRAAPVSDPRGDRITATKWRKGTGIEVRQCKWPECGKLVFSHASQKEPSELHQICMVEAMRSERGREWLSERRKLRDQGVPTYEINRRLGTDMPVAGGARAGDPANLTRDLRWAVLYLLGGDSQSSLAREAGVSQPTVAQAIDRTIALLPPPEMIPKLYQPLVERLRARRRVSA